MKYERYKQVIGTRGHHAFMRGSDVILATENGVRNYTWYTEIGERENQRATWW